MRASWQALHTNLLRSTSSFTFHTRFRSIPGLERFREPAQLFEFVHGNAAAPEARNAALVDLVRSAQRDDAASETAITLLLLALWPGLDAVHWRLARHFREHPEDLVSEIAARTTLGIGRLDLAKVRRIAATLVRNTERDIRRNLTRRRVERTCQIPATDELAGCPRSGRDLWAEIARITLRLRDWVGDDAPLIVAVTVVGLSQREAAEALGITHNAARKRYQRGLARLRQELAA